MQEDSNKKLYSDLVSIIEQGKQKVAVQVNSALTLVFWEVGKKVNETILLNQRASYGKEIVTTLSSQLVKQFGRSFESKNLRRMIQFANQFPDFEIVVTLSRQLSWSHFIVLFPLSNKEAKQYYASKIATENWSVRQTRKEIANKNFERLEIANAQVYSDKNELQIFKDPYFLIS